jgi:hypothetical protein
MTLIISVVTREHVAQASDRRITIAFPGGRYRVASDKANKSIYVRCLDAQFSIAYTGLARVGAFPTASWLSDFLVNAGAAQMPLANVLQIFHGRIKRTSHFGPKSCSPSYGMASKSVSPIESREGMNIDAAMA